MNVYIVRHGQSEGNASGVHQPPNSPLSGLGIIQADKIASRFENMQVDVIIASPLLRAKQTATQIAKITKAKLHIDPRLQELKRPTSVVGKRYDEPKVALLWETIDQHKEEEDYHLEDEENFFDLKTRLINLLDDLAKRPEQNIVLVSHGFAILTLTGLMIFGKEFTARQFYRMTSHLHMANTGLTVAQYIPGEEWAVHTINDRSHLLD